MRFKSRSAKTTQRLAVEFARQIRKMRKNKDHALVLGFVGGLGTGKTTFIQGFAHGFKLKKLLPSPTFLIMRSYGIKTKYFKKLFHVDAYRLKSVAELKPLNFTDVLADPQNLVLIEWAEKIKNFLPGNSVWLRLKHGRRPNERIINIAKSRL